MRKLRTLVTIVFWSGLLLVLACGVLGPQELAGTIRVRRLWNPLTVVLAACAIKLAIAASAKTATEQSVGVRPTEDLNGRTGRSQSIGGGPPRFRSRAAHNFGQLALACCLVAAAVFAFHPTLPVPFLCDDYYFLSQASQATPGTLLHGFVPSGGPFMRPVPEALWAAEWSLWAIDPSAYRRTNVTLHILNALLVTWLGASIFRHRWAAWAAGFVFALHPSHVEPVVWICCRYDLVCTFFAFLALGTLWLSVERKSTSLACVSTCCYVLALWSKEAAFFWPLAMAVTLWIGRPSRGLSLVRPLAPHIAVMATYAIVRVTCLSGVGGYDLRPLDVLGNALALPLRPIGALLVPLNQIECLQTPLWARSLAIVALLMPLLVLWTDSGATPRRAILGCWLVYLFSAIPGFGGGTLPVDLQGMRLLYLPSAGICWCLALVLSSLRPGRRTAVLFLLLVALMWGIRVNSSAWLQAGALAMAIRHDVYEALSAAGPRGHVVVAGLPKHHHGAFLYSPHLALAMSMLDGVPANRVVESSVPSTQGRSDAILLVWDERLLRLRAVGP